MQGKDVESGFKANDDVIITNRNPILLPQVRHWLPNFFPEGWKRDPSSLKTLLVSFLFYLFFLYVMTVMSNIASYLSPIDMKPLKDAGFKVIPKVDLLHLTDASILLSLAITWSMIFFADKKPISSSIRILQNSCLITIFRGATIAITSFPDPRTTCSRVEDSFLTTFVLHRCGDCMFSGHTASVTILALHWLSVKEERYSSRNQKFTTTALYYIAKIVSILCVPLGVWAILSNRTHYTVDVLVSLIITTGTWISWHYVTDRMS